jgi:hypothetical protein
MSTRRHVSFPGIGVLATLALIVVVFAFFLDTLSIPAPERGLWRGPALFVLGIILGMMMQTFFWSWVRTMARRDRADSGVTRPRRVIHFLETVREYVANEPAEPARGPGSRP